MIFKVGNEIVDTDTTPVGLVFKTKEEAIIVGNILSSIINGNSEYPTEYNGNWWFMCPEGMTADERDRWSTLTEDQKKILQETPEVTPKLTDQF